MTACKIREEESTESTVNEYRIFGGLQLIITRCNRFRSEKTLVFQPLYRTVITYSECAHSSLLSRCVLFLTLGTNVSASLKNRSALCNATLLRKWTLARRKSATVALNKLCRLYIRSSIGPRKIKKSWTFRQRYRTYSEYDFIIPLKGSNHRHSSHFCYRVGELLLEACRF